jgi:hypothetical protein
MAPDMSAAGDLSCDHLEGASPLGCFRRSLAGTALLILSLIGEDFDLMFQLALHVERPGEERCGLLDMVPFGGSSEIPHAIS